MVELIATVKFTVESVVLVLSNTVWSMLLLLTLPAMTVLFERLVLAIVLFSMRPVEMVEFVVVLPRTLELLIIELLMFDFTAELF